ncbi:multicopper oxidase family protein [Amycolatopsis sp. NPDC021455]|uniref:multicopper oxidase family protein n=1 Tax=Amycolatopsis sp. NPDC021455 TaxID=3154901 RepID=UPI0033F371A2
MGLYAALSRTDSVLSIVALLLGLAALPAVAGLDRGRGKPRLRSLLARLTLWGFVLCALGKVVVAALVLGGSGFVVAADRLIVTVPTLLLPAVALVVLTWPRLRGVVREARAAGGFSPQLRARAAAPLLVAPVYVAIVAAGADVRFSYFAAPQPPYFDAALFVAGLCALTAAGTTLLQRWIVGRRLAERRTSAARLARFAAVVCFGVVPVIVSIAVFAGSTALPGRYNMLDMGGSGDADGSDMAGMHHGMGQSGGGARSVADLTGPKNETPDVRYRLTARKATLTVDGHPQEALTFDGTSPGPELRVRRGRLIEVTLVNADIAEGVTIHWHGIELPNAEDGVAGVTQDAVKPGGTHVYRFRPQQAGTFWYHSHQESNTQVAKGLFGALIVEPDAPQDPPGTLDVTAMAHVWDKVATVNTTAADLRQAKPGQRVRARLVNTDRRPVRFAVTGTPFKVDAVDGRPVHEPGEVTGKGLLVGGGGRNDVTFTMPDGPVTITAFVDARDRELADDKIADPAIVFSPDGKAGAAKAETPDEDVDLGAYGTPAPVPFTADSKFAVESTQYLDYMFFGFYDGALKTTYSVNGKLFPDTPMLMVHEGDLVKVTFVNRSIEDHPMHPHGHVMQVLSHDGKPVTGSPWWTDTLNVEPGGSYEVAFKADNPGVWMDHCHNFEHAAGGMTMHLAYYGVTEPFEAGRDTGNHPE